MRAGKFLCACWYDKRTWKILDDARQEKEDTENCIFQILNLVVDFLDAALEAD
jgi:hypothetical protein